MIKTMRPVSVPREHAIAGVVLCPCCTADTCLDARDAGNPGRVCPSCGWDSRRDADDDLAQYRTGPYYPAAMRAIGAKSVPALMGEIRRLSAEVEAWKLEAGRQAGRAAAAEAEAAELRGLLLLARQLVRKL